jgi:hypothetical protein
MYIGLMYIASCQESLSQAKINFAYTYWLRVEIFFNSLAGG